MKIVSASTLDESGRAVAAALLAESFVQFYNSLGLDQARLLAALADELVELGTEMEFTRTLIDADVPIGVMAAYPADQMAERQQASLFHLVSSFEDHAEAIFEACASHAALVSTVPVGSFYLARLAIYDRYRGTGCAALMLRQLRSEAADRPVSLHVHSENVRAIALYERNGFTLEPDQSSGIYRCMTGR